MKHTEELSDLYAYPTGVVRPWVRSNFVASIDGSVVGPDGLSGSLGGAPDSRVFALLRSLCDVIVVGSGTARAEGYRPVETNEVDQVLRAKLGLAAVPAIAVVSRSLHVPEELLAPGQLLITCAAAPEAKRSELSKRVDVIVAGHEQIDWPEALAGLAERGLTRVLCEGGPTLHGALVELDLIDELCLTIDPHIVLGQPTPIAKGEQRVDRRLELAHSFGDSGVLFTRWLRKRG